MNFENVYDFVTFIIYLVLLLHLAVGLVTFFCFIENKRNIQVDKFLSSLDEHEKSVICDYDNARRVFFKKKKIKFKDTEALDNENK